MKVGIVTVYDSLNSGAFLQAYALKLALEKDGNEVYHLKTGARNKLKMFLRRVDGDLKKKKIRIRDYWFYGQTIKKFANNKKSFRRCAIGDTAYNQLKIVIFGSDEMWNISRKDFLKYPIFWGKGVEGKRRIAFAPSMNNATVQDLERAGYPVQEIQKFSSVMVRDLHSQKELQKIYSKHEVKLVLDPTFLLKKEEYRDVEIPCKEKEFIMIYSYGKGIDENAVNEIKAFSKRTNLQLIAVGLYQEWCDKNIPVTPFEFLGYMDRAQYVITDTFHGAVFSIIYEKQFVSYGKNKKSRELLKQFDLKDREINNDQKLSEIFNKTINYLRLGQIRSRMSDESLQLLMQAVHQDDNR